MYKAFYCANSIAGDVRIVVSYQTNELSDLIFTVITRYSIILHTRGKLSLQHVSATYLKCVPTVRNVKGNTIYVYRKCLRISLAQPNTCKHICSVDLVVVKMCTVELFSSVATFSMNCSELSLHNLVSNYI